VVEKAERKYGEFTQTFKIPQEYEYLEHLLILILLLILLLLLIPQEYERKWSKCVVSNGVLKLSNPNPNPNPNPNTYPNPNPYPYPYPYPNLITLSRARCAQARVQARQRRGGTAGGRRCV
jgi:hypothetical protein